MNHQDTETQRRALNDLSHRVLGLCLEVHRELGPGLLESAYEEALAYEFTQSGLTFERQKEMPLHYKGVSLNCGYRLDFLVEGELILELKAANGLSPIHYAQLLTYLRLERRSLGLLINFNVPVLKAGIHRVVSGDLFKDTHQGWSEAGQFALLLCVLVSLWLKRML